MTEVMSSCKEEVVDAIPKSHGTDGVGGARLWGR